MHIVAYLGYLIGSNNSGEFRYVIISRDKDYDKIIDFMEKETGVRVERTASIDPTAAKKADQRGKKHAHARKKSSGSTAARSSKGSNGQGDSAEGNQNHEDNNTRQRRNGRGTQNSSLNRKSSANKRLDKVQVAETAQNRGRGVTETKPASAEMPKTSSVPDIKTRMNQDIQKKLSSSGMTADIANYVASVAVKNAGEKNGKQITYQAIVKKYGMVKGLNIYRHVKKLIP